MKSVLSVVPFDGTAWSSGQSSPGSSVPQSVKSLQSGQIHSDLLALYRLISPKAPNAQVLVVSYPHFLPKNGFMAIVISSRGVLPVLFSMVSR